MNKTELITAVAQTSGLTKADASRALDATLSTIQKQLKKGQDVRLTGFGTFRVTKRAARKGRNPRTGATIQIAASKSPAFRPGKEFKEAVNR